MQYTTEQVKNMVYYYREDMLSRGIKVGKVMQVRFNKSPHDFGFCQKIRKGVYVITITDLALHGDIKSTVVHELIHAVDGCYNHGSKFQTIAKELSKAYNIELGTTASSKEMEMTKEYRLSKAKYVIKCTNSNCNCMIFRYRAVGVVVNPDKYKCGECGSNLLRIR